MSPLLLHVFATFAPGGPQVRAARLLEAIGPSFRHAILAMDGCTDARELLPAGVEARVLEPPPRAGSPRTTLRLRRILRSLRPDLLLTYNWGAIDALSAALLVRGPAVLHHEDGFLPDELESFKRRRIWARRVLLARAAAVVVPSFRLERIATETWRLPADRVHRIPNGIRLERFEPADGNASLRAELGIPPGAPVVGACGHLRAEKNPARLVEALAAMQAEAHLLLVGDGPERARVEELVRRNRLEERVHLAGHRADPTPCYRAMDVFCLTSDTEQMPVALLEAMASRLPVVATDVGDVRRMLPADQDEFVLPVTGAATPAALGAALDRLCRDADLRARLGERNRERARAEFSFERMRREHEALWSLHARGA